MDLSPGTLSTLGLVLVRTSAFVLASPLLGDGSGFGGYKVGLIGVLSLLSFAVLDVPLEAAVGPLEFGAMAAREALIGIALAFVMQCALLAVRVGGELIGHEMAFNMSSIADPATGINTPLITRIYEGLFLLGFLAVDGHHLLVRALADSFARAPVGHVAVEAGLAQGVRILFSEMFTAGLTFAAPVTVLLVLVSLLIGLLARAVPQLNVLEVGFTLRILVALVAMLVFAPLFAPAMAGLYEALDAGLETMLEGLEA
jgi:flagellar biosynthetic protein FliR